VNPGIILLSMPPFGANGPWATFRAYGSTVEHSSGLPHLNGSADEPPAMHHVAYGDAMGGLTGASALLVALRHQARTGEGQFVDLSQVEGLFPLAIHGILEQAALGHAPARTGNRRADKAPHGVYPCQGEDNWIVIQVETEAQWQALREKSGLDFGDLSDRLARVDELEQGLSSWTAQHEAKALMYDLQASGIPAAATYRASELLEHDQLEARKHWQWLERAIVGNQPNPSSPVRSLGGNPPDLAADPISIDRPAPTSGEHNEDVLRDILGLSDEQIRALNEEAIIGTKPRMPSRR